MSVGEALAVALAGGLGAVLRAELTVRAADAARATEAVNVVGAAALGLAVAVLDGTWLLVVGTGLLGATTTFSTWMVQVRASAHPVRRALVLLVVGVAAAAGGRATGMLVV